MKRVLSFFLTLAVILVLSPSILADAPTHIVAYRNTSAQVDGLNCAEVSAWKNLNDNSKPNGYGDLDSQRFFITKFTQSDWNNTDNYVGISVTAKNSKNENVDITGFVGSYSPALSMGQYSFPETWAPLQHITKTGKKEETAKYYQLKTNGASLNWISYQSFSTSLIANANYAGLAVGFALPNDVVLTDDVTVSISLVRYSEGHIGEAVSTPHSFTFTKDYSSIGEAVAGVNDSSSIPVLEEVTLGSGSDTVEVPANSTISVANTEISGSASAKELTITKSDNTTETAYLVTVGATTSAVRSSNIDNEVVAQDSSGNTLSGKEAAAQLFDIPKVLASVSNMANAAVADVDFAMKVDGNVTQKTEHTKTFDVYPVATVGTAEYEVPADALKAQKYSVTLDLGVANAGMYARLTHYKSDSSSEVLGTYLIRADGKVNFTMDSFSPVGADVIYAEDDATFTLTVDAPDTIDVDTEFAVEVKLTSSVDTNLNTIKFSYSLPDGFTEVAGSKTGCLAAAAEQTGGNWIWNAGGGANIALTANTPASLGTFKAKVAQANAVYNADKTFTFNSATLTFSGVPYKEYTANAASDTTKVTTTYTITWNYNGGKVGSNTSKTDTVGVNVTPTAPEPVKPGYILSWNPTVDKATADVTYIAVWTLDTVGMSVKFNDYGYAYLLNSETDYDKLLVLKASTPTEGYAYAIDGSLMFATTNANYGSLVSAGTDETVYVYIVSGNETQTTILGDGTVGGATKLSVVEGTNEVLAYDGDLNRDGSAKQGDLGVLVDLFNGRAIYGRIGPVNIRARLEADIDSTANAEASFKSIADVNELIRKLFPATGG